jgi:adenylate cyclase
MRHSADQDPEERFSRKPVPHDVRKAIRCIRAALHEPLSMARLASRCGVAPRTLTDHFCAFVGVSPMQYLRRLRLAAAREQLLAAGPGTSVTAVARTYGFNHFGRFAEQYRRSFGETPSETLRHGRAAALAHGSEEPAERGGQAAETDVDRQPARAAIPSREKPTVAIFPGHVLGHEPSLRILAQAVADALAIALSSVRSLAVLVPTSPRLAGREPQRSARELGARYVLTGSVSGSEARLRLTLRLVDAATGHHIWGDYFEGEGHLALQDHAEAAVLRGIVPSIRGAEIDRASRAPPRSLDAHGLAMRAFPFLLASRPEASRRALELLHRAIDIDPDYGLAAALAAWGHSQLVMYSAASAPPKERQRAETLSRRAAILDEDDPLVLTARCAVHTMAREFDTAEALVARALAIDPTCGWAWSRSGWLHCYRGNSELALEHFRRALSLDPNFPKGNELVGIGGAYFNAGHYEAAASWLQRAVREHPSLVWANRSLSVSLARTGDRLKALASLDALRRSYPDLTVGRVVDSVPFEPEFLDRLGNGLLDLGLPP